MASAIFTAHTTPSSTGMCRSPSSFVANWAKPAQPSRIASASSSFLAFRFGGTSEDVKPFKSVGSGVVEIALRYDTDAYRTVVALHLGKKLYVLHAF
jgi:hypothetical protein